MLNPQELLDIEKIESYRRKRNAAQKRKTIWITRRIPYYLDPGLCKYRVKQTKFIYTISSSSSRTERVRILFFTLEMSRLIKDSMEHFSVAYADITITSGCRIIGDYFVQSFFK